MAEDFAPGGITLQSDKREFEERLSLRIEDTLRNLQRAYDARPRDDGFDYETPLLHIMAQVQQLQRRVKEVFEEEEVEAAWTTGEGLVAEAHSDYASGAGNGQTRGE